MSGIRNSIEDWVKRSYIEPDQQVDALRVANIIPGGAQWLQFIDRLLLWGGSVMIAACIGGTLGLITANIIGLIIGSFAGAVVLELLKGGGLKASVKVGYGTLIGFLCGAVVKVIIAFIMVGYFILQVWR